MKYLGLILFLIFPVTYHLVIRITEDELSGNKMLQNKILFALILIIY